MKYMKEIPSQSRFSWKIWKIFNPAEIQAKEHSEEKAGELFDTILEQGIIDERKGGRYGIPIPSMHTWLLGEYGREKENLQQMDKTTEKEGIAKDSQDSEKFQKSRFTKER